MTLDLFPTYKIKKPVRLIELFAGYGSQALALERLGVNFEHHQVVEFDKYAIKTYNALHDTNFETQDITQLKELDIKNSDKYNYILTYSFPCTDLSLAGKRAGMTKGSGTSSGLLWEVERLLLESKELPQVLVMENVPAIHSVKFNDQFRLWQDFLAKLGYSNQWQDLNAKDYGVPQNRVRTFMVSILGNYECHFPKPFELKLKLKDLLDDNVDEKYFLNEKQLRFLQETNYRSMGIDSVRKIDDSFMHTITTMQGGNREPKIAVPEKTSKGYTEAYEGDGVYINRPHQKRGVVQKDMIQTIKSSSDDLGVVTNDLRIRKLTPREVLRLMGLYDQDIDKIIDVNSNAQLYKQAGNSIVVNVLEHLFGELFI